MRTISGLFGRLGLVGVTIGILACGSDTLLDPTQGSGCNVGAMHAGDTVTSSFGDSSCAFTTYYWTQNRVPYESYTVALSQGKAYMFTESNVPDPAHGGRDDVDAQLTLWGKNSDGVSVPLAGSDDDAGGLNSVLFFVAPVSGTFQLVATSYNWDDFGGYRLTMNECPVLGVLDTAGTYNFTLGASPCIRPRAGNFAEDTSAYSFVSFNAGAGELVSSQVTSAAFPPVWEMFGPGFDTYGHIYDEIGWSHTRGSGNSASFTMGTTGGLVTLAVGATTVDSTAGAFSITLGRTPPAAPPIGAAPWSLARVPFMTRRAAPPPKR